MTHKRSERSRWVTIYHLTAPDTTGATAELRAARAQIHHEQLYAVVSAFQKVNRAVRIEPGKYGSTIDIKARRT